MSRSGRWVPRQAQNSGVRRALRSQTAQSPEAGSAGRLSQPTVEARRVALGQQLCASVSSSIKRGPRQYLLPGTASSHREPSTMAWPQGWRAQQESGW